MTEPAPIGRIALYAVQTYKYLCLRNSAHHLESHIPPNLPLKRRTKCWNECPVALAQELLQFFFEIEAGLLKRLERARERTSLFRRKQIGAQNKIRIIKVTCFLPR